MSEPTTPTFHSLETMRLLKETALPTHGENFDGPGGGMSRRSLLKLLGGASAALAIGLPGCQRKPLRKIVSRVSGPEYQKPGKPLYYASTWTEGAQSYGMLIKTVDGRPVKVDGNPEHPINRGAATAAMQASVLSLYDPDRLRRPQRGNKAVSWADADTQIITALKTAKSVVLLTRSTLGPAERSLIAKFLKTCPGSQHFVHEAVHDGPRRSAWKKIYGADGEMLPRYSQAKVILSLDCDFMGTDGAVLKNIRGYAKGRTLHDADHRTAEMSRLYVAEGAMTLTGSNADQRIRLRPSAMTALANALRAAVGGDRAALAAFASAHRLDAHLLRALADDLSSNRGAALVVSGAHLPESTHAAVALLNDALGAPGHTLEWNAFPATLPVSNPTDVKAALQQGPDVVICLGVNPVYDWPGGNFEALLKKTKLTVAHVSHLDETGSACTLALPSCHNLESWNDAQPRTGLMTLCQPVIAPLFDGRQEAESLLTWTKGLAADSEPLHQANDWHAYLGGDWRLRLAPDDSGDVATLGKRAWETALHDGLHGKSSVAPPPSLNRTAAESLATATSAIKGHELVILPHPAIHDGRFANNGWLQELPDPVSKLVWDNAVAMSRTDAAALGVSEGDLVSVKGGGRSVDLPVLVQPGMAEGVLAVTLGHGRTTGGKIIEEAGGVNVSPLMGASTAPRLASGVRISKAAGSRKLVRTQTEFSMHERPIVLDGSLAEYRRESDFVKHRRHLPADADLYDPIDYSKGHKWGMSIDLGSCVGCNACVTACQAENNIPIVGREECDNGREMHWLRIDRYEDGDADEPKVSQQPMLCQHCDNAPCENVCPVNATTHSPEGLNEMVYNRCVGTRYCANNCPYKVRRFNFLRYQQAQLRDPVQELAFNPQVTVRGVGVMEKCTFCVQRINEAKFSAANAETPLTPDAVQTACQQTCPSQAIVFGDLNDADSAAAKLRASGRAYHVLEELNVKPNVTYLARVRNPHAHDTHDAADEQGSHRG